MNTQTNSHPYSAPKPEALVSSVDLEEFKSGLTNYKAGRWHEDRWKTFRLRFGIYEQRQKGQHMVRIKVPGGRLSAEQAHTIAKANANHAGGSVHITTRQAIQLYFVDLDKLYDLLAELNLGGVTTRESSGGTFRNTTACALSANCEAANTDAVKVAENLSRAWLRNPLVQHMPRKVKTAVSGCELDCGLTPIDDLGFIATNKNGNSGFRVVLGGGLGTHPRTAVNIFDFVSEHDLPAVQEAVARIHHRYSNRENKNKSRLKFLVDKFGAEELTKLIKNEFEKIKPL
ncbi:MAG: nitrite/sulfite reductase, partial [Rhodospirillaceae bacterium]|nr:nitrite/sulfite reductase [Rhodospirillaceae bacterium]